MFKEKAQTQCSSIPMAQQKPSNSPAINLVSFHFTLLEKRRKKLSEKEKPIFLLYLLLLSSTEDLVKRESGGKISPEVCRKLYPTWSSQCKKQQKGSCTGAVVVNGFEVCPYLFIFTSFGNKCWPVSLCLPSDLPKLSGIWEIGRQLSKLSLSKLHSYH